jgi:Domain of unknown function (DUF5134)
MSGPIWLSWSFAGLMAICVLYHGARLVTARLGARTNGSDIDLAHLALCPLMVAMLLVSAGTHLGPAWAVVVVAAMGWFILRGLRAVVADDADAMMPPAQQVLMCSAMLFMLVVAGRPVSAMTMVTGGMNMPGMPVGGHVSDHLVASTSSVAVTSWVFIGLLGLVAARHARQLKTAASSHRPKTLPARADLSQRAGAVLIGPGLHLGGQLAMSATMIYMLVLMA